MNDTTRDVRAGRATPALTADAPAPASKSQGWSLFVSFVKGGMM